MENNTVEVSREAQKIINDLGLIPHPEGGYFQETLRSSIKINTEKGVRNAVTSIYYLVNKGEKSALHRLTLSDEVWNFYAGGSFHLLEIDPESGEEKITILGNNLANGETLQYTVKKGNWFGGFPGPKTDYSLMGCIVSPGFDFNDFEFLTREEFEKNFRHLRVKRDYEKFLH